MLISGKNSSRRNLGRLSVIGSRLSSGKNSSSRNLGRLKSSSGRNRGHQPKQWILFLIRLGRLLFHFGHFRPERFIEIDDLKNANEIQQSAERACVKS